MHGLDAVPVPGPCACNRSSLAFALRAQVFERSEGRSSFSESLKLSFCSEPASPHHSHSQATHRPWFALDRDSCPALGGDAKPKP